MLSELSASTGEWIALVPLEKALEGLKLVPRSYYDVAKAFFG